MWLNLVEIAHAVNLVTITPPAATPEKFAAEIGDFPRTRPGRTELARPTWGRRKSPFIQGLWKDDAFGQ